MHIQDFVLLPSEHQAAQDEGLRWLGWLHAKADPSRTPEAFTKMFTRFGCDSKRIATRGYEHPQYCQFSDDVAARFLNFAVSDRMAFFEKVVDRRMEQFYERKSKVPSLLIHVSCTGYVSPSAAQKIVVNKGWQQNIAISHAYHMGCYAALPSIRQATEHLSMKPEGQVDIVHNELCTLHLDPHNHAPEQLVVQSLFADGHIGYSVTREATKEALEIVTVREELIPASGTAMEWRVSEQGFEMTLAREIPEIIRGGIEGFLRRLCEQAGVQAQELEQAIFAIHPGGPRIIDLLEDVLRIRPEQSSYSRGVLRQHGNMSSATLPHIWEKILADKAVSKGTLVISFAFGPGLTVFGSVLRVVRP
jgi:predicted naringenin-chalcone synthase